MSLVMAAEEDEDDDVMKDVTATGKENLLEEHFYK